jgi:hypothetical protein
MARFYGSITNSRGNQVTAQGAANGQRCHIRGWSAGVVIDSHPHNDGPNFSDRTDVDEFDVFMSSGSRGGGHEVLLGTVVSSPDGPMFIPSDHVCGLPI